MIHELIDIKNKDNLNEYFKFKEKHSYSFTSDELSEFLFNLKNKILSLNENNQFNIVFVPETSNKNLLKLAREVAKKVFIVKKNNTNTILKLLEKQKFQKKEKEALFEKIKSLDTLKIAEIKGNQRVRFVDILFEDISKSIPMENSLLLDDSSFSGYTLKALSSKLPHISKKIIIFSKHF